MKKNLLAAAAAVAFLGSAVAANAETVGHLGANYSRSNVDVSSVGDANMDIFQAEGAVRFDVGSLGAQLDGSVTDGEDFDTTFAATGHLNTKVGGALVGGFVGVNTDSDVTLWGVGVEGQADLSPAVSLYGQAGYGSSDDLGDADLWAGRAEVRYFVSDTFKLQGQAGYVKADTDFGNIDAWTAGVEAEYQFANTPFSVLAGWDHTDSNDIDTNVDTVRVGVRYSFGGNLRQRVQSGAALGSVTQLFGAGILR